MKKEYIHSQRPALDLLESIGWKAISDPREEKKKVILTDILRKKLKEINSYIHNGKEYKFSDNDIQNAINSLRADLDSGLNAANKEIYDLLTTSKSFKGIDKRSHNLYFFDFHNLTNNSFHLIPEFQVKGRKNNCFVDIVLFVNGIPLVVIENKDSSVQAKEAISQIIRNQNSEYIPELFKYTQITIAMNSHIFKYGTCGTAKRFYSIWKEQDTKWFDKQLKTYIRGRLATPQDKGIISLLNINRFFDIFKNYILFDSNMKKIARYQQFFGIKELIKTVKERSSNGKRKGGIIWHTQGSGKSLTMVMFIKVLVSNPGISPNSRIIMITDRKNLDKQITATFQNTELKPYSTSSGINLTQAIKDDYRIITTIVNKFKTVYQQGVKDKSSDIFILIDESHRTEYGILNEYMENVFPNACYIGFTGTPLMKNEKKNTLNKFGGLIHKYTIQNAVDDKAIVPLIYEGKMIEQSINTNGIDRKIKQITFNMNEREAADLKLKWSKYNKIASSISRIDFIAYDIHQHFISQYRKNSNVFKAMLATNSKEEAIRYLRKFEEINSISKENLKVAVLVSPEDTRGAYENIHRASKSIVVEHWNEMMSKYKDENDYQETLKDDFKNGDLDLIIVVDKLLTGFDAPRAIVLYIDKQLKEHNLLQAIARVNRLYEGKDYGYIIDYRGLLDNLNEAMDLYSGAGLENFDRKDLKGALIDIVKISRDLLSSYSILEDFFISISNKTDKEEYEVYLEDKFLRDEFYEKLSLFGRNLKTVLGSLKASKEIGSKNLQKYKSKFIFYQNIRASIKIRYSDAIDFSEYESQMKNILDTYINAENVEQVIEPVDIMQIDKFEEEIDKLPNTKAKADAIHSRISKSLQDIKLSDPVRFEEFSKLLQTAYENYKAKRKQEADNLKLIDEYYKEMNEIKKKYQTGRNEKVYPAELRNNTNSQIIYDLIYQVKNKLQTSNRIDEFDFDRFCTKTAVDIDNHIEKSIKPEWHKNQDNINKMKLAVTENIFTYLKENSITTNFENITKLAQDIIQSAQERYTCE